MRTIYAMKNIFSRYTKHCKIARYTIKCLCKKKKLQKFYVKREVIGFKIVQLSHLLIF